MFEFGTYGVKVVSELIFVNPNGLALQAFDSREGSTQSDCSISMSLRPLKKVFVTQAFFHRSIYMMLQVLEPKYLLRKRNCDGGRN